LEAGPEGGDAVRQYANKQGLDDGPLEIVVHVGYRLQTRAPQEKFDGTLVDTVAEEDLEGIPPDTETPRVAFESDVVQEAGGGNDEYAVHNVSPEFLSKLESMKPAAPGLQCRVERRGKSHYNSNNATKFRIVQLPVNALETAGMDVARNIQQRAHNDNLQIYSMLPLACYPDQGTGMGRPFLLTDYQLPATMEKKLAWMHEMEHVPQAYDMALKTALQHFDANALLEKKAAQDRDLTAESQSTQGLP